MPEDLASLRRFFEDAFSSDDLRRFASKLLDGGNLVNALPPRPESHFELCAAFVEVLARRHALDGAFFRALNDERPSRRTEIAAIAAGVSAAFAPTGIAPVRLLRPPVPDFQGRTDELARLRAAVCTGGATITGLRGQGGIGKTELALAFAQEVAGVHPDGQVFIDLQGSQKAPRSPEEVLKFVVHTWHPDARLPDDLDHLTGIARQVLHGKRVVLLLDDASGPDQVRGLLPPEPGCLVIVTSRRHFQLPGMRPMNLDPLPEHDAVAFLLDIHPGIGDRSAELAGVCGYLPFALRLAATAIAERPDMDVERYLGRLQGRSQRAKLVEAVLSISVEGLEPEARDRWCALGVFPGTFDLLAAAAVWDIELDVADLAMGELTRQSLVQWNIVARRYLLHDLARDYALEQLDEEAGQQARRRHSTHFLHVLDKCERHYGASGNSVLAGLGLFEIERENVWAGFQWARAKDDELCRAYPLFGARVLGLRQHARERVSWLEAALPALRRIGDRRGEGKALGCLGIAYGDLADMRSAIGHFENQLVVARQIGDRRMESGALGNLGTVFRRLGEVRRAISHFEMQLVVAREYGDLQAEGSTLGNLGLAHFQLGDFALAVSYHEQALARSRESGDRRGEGHDLGNLGLAYRRLGEVAQARRHHEQQLSIAREIRDSRLEGNALGGLGLSCRDHGELHQAIEYYERQMVIAREIDDRQMEGNALGNLGGAYLELGDVPQSIAHLSPSLAIACEIGDRCGEGNGNYHLGEACARLGDMPTALAYARRALELFEAIESPDTEWARILVQRLEK